MSAKLKKPSEARKLLQEKLQKRIRTIGSKYKSQNTKAHAPEGMQTIMEDEREDTVGDYSRIKKSGVSIDPAGDFAVPMRIKQTIN